MELHSEMIEIQDRTIGIRRRPVLLVCHGTDEETRRAKDLRAQLENDIGLDLKLECANDNPPFITRFLEEKVLVRPERMLDIVVLGKDRFVDYTDWELSDDDWRLFFGKKLFNLVDENHIESFRKRIGGSIEIDIRSPCVPLLFDNDFTVAFGENRRFSLSKKLRDIFSFGAKKLTLDLRGHSEECEIVVTVKPEGGSPVIKSGKLKTTSKFEVPSGKGTPRSRKSCDEKLREVDSALFMVIQKLNESRDTFCLISSSSPILEIDPGRFLFCERDKIIEITWSQNDLLPGEIGSDCEIHARRRESQ